ncbi:alpha/beta fold hydrolase [Natrononativus amylolyticus]|uniref:alpha/beta fold hydrolase n=1 Tax=Natrononativus amylolyticus TaxID=2963434 RepID=UPI0020CF8774|nr:alpha/beta hydrolase [Natrononativus amylolyticus]
MDRAIDDRVDHRDCLVGGLRLHYVAAGPTDGPLVVLLHGFPEHWYSWRRQLPALADAGYRVVAPDMRGYNRSEKPHGVDAYRLERLTGDLTGLIETLEGDGASARVVGHDWGGVVAWATATARPAVVDRLVVLNAPHPTKYVRELSAEQAARAWYAMLFQLPRFPEALLRADGYRALEDIFREEPIRPGAFTEDEISRFVRAMARPGALTSALNYYRAFARHTVRENAPGAIPIVGRQFVDPVERIEAPTLVLWGERDGALTVEQTEGLERYASDVRVRRYPDAGHWIHADRPESVTAELRSFLSD